MSSTLNIKLLGGFNMTYGEKPVEVTHSMRLQLLLAYLLLHRDVPQSRQYLAFTFWPDSSEAQALTNLRQSLHHLRKVLPELHTYLHIDNRKIAWKHNTSLIFDVAEFESHVERSKQSEKNNKTEQMVMDLEEAVILYGGDLFPGCYDDWIEPIRQRIKDEFIDVLYRLTEYHERQRNIQRAIYYGERLLNVDTLREKTYVDLMRLHALNNDRGSIARIYIECERVLNKELNVIPARETTDLYTRLITDNTQLADRKDEQWTSHLSDDLPLVGRHNEWRLLLHEWQQVLQGAVRFVSITGEPGIGKTRLGVELFEYVRKLGYGTAYSRAYEVADRLSYRPVTEWLREDIFYNEITGLDRIWQTELTRLLPKLFEDSNGLPAPRPLNEKWQRQTFFQAIANAFFQKNKPILLYLDDIQWCDRETLEWLGYVFHSRDIQNLLVLVTLRPVESTSNKPLQNFLDVLRREELMTEVQVTGLNQSESIELASRVGRDTAMTYPDIYKESEGNPLFVIELVRQGYFRNKQSIFTQQKSHVAIRTEFGTESIPLPPKVNAVISARFDQLSENTRELMRLAGSIGREFQYEILIGASGLDEKAVIGSLEELLVHRIIREVTPATYDFSHDKIREVAYRNMSTVRRIFLHREIARAIESIFLSDLKKYSSTLAYHYDRANMYIPAATYYVEAAENARAIYANEESASLIQRALVLLEQVPEGNDRDRIERDLQSGLALTLIHIKGYASDEVFKACSRVFSLCEQLNEPPPASMKRLFAIANICIGRFDTAYALGKDLLDHAQQARDNVELVEACYLVGSVLLRWARYDEAKKYYEKGLENFNPEKLQFHLNHFGQDPYAVCTVRLSKIALLEGDYDKSDRLESEALKRAKDINHPFTIDLVRADIINNYVLRNDVRATRKLAEEALLNTDEYVFPFFYAVCKLYLGWSLFHLGFEEEGIAEMYDRLSAVEIMYLSDMAYFKSLLAECLCSRGRVHEALLLSDDAIEMIEATDVRWLESEIYRIRGKVIRNIHPSDPGQARKCFEKAIEIAHSQKVPIFEQRALRDLKNRE